MDLLWQRGPLKGKEVHEALRKKKRMALTTVLTVLDRLSKKGFVRKDRDSGPTVFSAAISRDEFAARVASELITSAYELAPGLAVSAFTDIFSKMNSDELDRLARLIAEKRDESHKQN